MTNNYLKIKSLEAVIWDFFRIRKLLLKKQSVMSNKTFRKLVKRKTNKLMTRKHCTDRVN